MRDFTPKVFVTPFGGHATSMLLRYWWKRDYRFWPRPDFPFSYGLEPYDLHSLIDWDEKFVHHVGRGQLYKSRRADWEFRTHTEPQADKTIHQNLVEFIDGTNDNILLFGKCSLTEPFLTNNKITNALFIVRHPLDAYDSLFGRQHPKWAKTRGGPTSVLLAEDYALKWNKVVEDMLSNRENYDTPLVRYETFIEDLREAGINKLARIFKSIWYNRPRREFITPAVEEFIRQITYKNFKQIYSKW